MWRWQCMDIFTWPYPDLSFFLIVNVSELVHLTLIWSLCTADVIGHPKWMSQMSILTEMTVMNPDLSPSDDDEFPALVYIITTFQMFGLQDLSILQLEIVTVISLEWICFSLCISGWTIFDFRKENHKSCRENARENFRLSS